jgi:UDP-glucose 4-epimerase
MVCLVTGAGGFIGRRLIRSMGASVEIVAVVRPGGEAIPGAAQTVGIDLALPWDPFVLLPAKVDAIVHLAQSRRHRDFPDGADDMFEVNVASTHRLLEYARRTRASHFILASSGGVYAGTDAPLTEADRLDTTGSSGFYLASKISAEALAGCYRDLFKLVVLRLFFVYGASQNEGMLIPRLARSIRAGQPVVLHGHDGIRLNPVHVSDTVFAIEQALGVNRSVTVNVAGSDVLTLRRIAETIGELVDRKPQFTTVPDDKPRHFVADIRRMVDLFGKPRVRFEDGIREVVSVPPQRPTHA